MSHPSIPVTVLSGFVGAGKTALRNHVLQQCGGLHVGFLVNNLDDDCFCCAGREELLQEVQLQAQAGFDYLLIEMNGLAEPLAVAETLAPVVRLDTLVTVVDAVHFLRDAQEADYLYDRGLAQGEEDDRTVVDLLIEQVEFADTLLLNKCDQVDPQELARLEAILGYLNPGAMLLRAEFGRVPVDQVLNTHRFDFERVSQGPGWLQVLRGDLAETAEFGLGSFVYRARRPFHPERFWQWLQRGQTGVLRARGLFWCATRPDQAGLWSQAGGACRLEPAGRWPITKGNEIVDGPRQELVFLGTHLDRAGLTESLDTCLLTDTEVAEGSLTRALPDPFGDWDADEH